MPSRKSSLHTRHRGRLFVVIGIISVIISILFFMTSAINRAKTMRFSYSGQEVKADIERLDWKGVPRELYITYKYVDAFGKERHGTDEYPFGDDAKDFKVGQKIDVLVLMNFPDQTRIARRQTMMMMRMSQLPWLNTAAIAVLGVICIGVGMM